MRIWGEGGGQGERRKSEEVRGTWDKERRKKMRKDLGRGREIGEEGGRRE